MKFIKLSNLFLFVFDHIPSLYCRSEKILAGPTFFGRVEEFCRQKGHGFIIPCDGGDKLFVHISE